jgi:hypothetical protein
MSRRSTVIVVVWRSSDPASSEISMLVTRLRRVTRLAASVSIVVAIVPEIRSVSRA